jgi:hypothetical protein
VCDDGVPVRSLVEGGRSWASSPSLTMVMEVADRVLWEEGLFLRRFSGSLSRSLSFLGLLRSRSGSFLRRLGSEELNIATARGGVAGGCYCSRAGLGVREGGILDVNLAPARLPRVVRLGVSLMCGVRGWPMGVAAGRPFGAGSGGACATGEAVLRCCGVVGWASRSGRCGRSGGGSRRSWWMQVFLTC